MQRIRKNKLVTYSIPDGVNKNENFKVRIRPYGEDEWQYLSAYTVKVDMHDVRESSMIYFDFEGCVEVEIDAPVREIYSVLIRPLNHHIVAEYSQSTVRFKLDKPVNISVEINKDRFHNLHLFAGDRTSDEDPKCMGEAIYVLGDENPNRPKIIRTKDVVRELVSMNKGRVLFFKPGFYYLEECCMNVPSDTTIYISGGAVIVGGFICEQVEHVNIIGRGVVYQGSFERYHSLRGVRLSYCENIRIEGICFVNPPHYTVYIGQSRDIDIMNIKTFSCEGWSDGIDIMSSEDITIEGCFIRTSDDCIAIYGSRWNYKGNSRNIYVKNCALWADVAHPTMIGIHGDHDHDGNIIEEISFENIDILEHHEIQGNYLGCLCINVGDGNIARKIRYEDIRIEAIEHGKIFDIQVKFNPDYNPRPGHSIENVRMKNIYCHQVDTVQSCIQGYDEQHVVKDIIIENLIISNERVALLNNPYMTIGPYVENVILR